MMIADTMVTARRACISLATENKSFMIGAPLKIEPTLHRLARAPIPNKFNP